MILNWKSFNESIRVSSDEYIELLRTDDYLLTVPLTHKAARKYGMGTKWCLTNRCDPSDFERHSRLGKIVYIVIRNVDLQKEFGTTAWCVYLLNGKNKFNFISFNDKNQEFKGGYNYLVNEFEKVDRESDFWKIMNKYFKWVESDDQLNESFKFTIPILMSLIMSLKSTVSSAQISPAKREVYIDDLETIKSDLRVLGEQYMDIKLSLIISKINNILESDFTTNDISKLSKDLENYVIDTESSVELLDSLDSIRKMEINKLEAHRLKLMSIYNNELQMSKKSSTLFMLLSIIIILIVVILVRRRKETI
jgi:hypothetical protein